MSTYAVRLFVSNCVCVREREREREHFSIMSRLKVAMYIKPLFVHPLIAAVSFLRVT
jgi:hypothetical protein